MRYLANFLNGLHPIHFGHHDVHEDDVDVRVGHQDIDGFATVVRRDDIHLMLFEDTGQGEDVARIVVDDQNLLVDQQLVRLMQVQKRGLGGLRQAFKALVQVQGEHVEQAVCRLYGADGINGAETLQCRRIEFDIAEQDDRHAVEDDVVLLTLGDQFGDNFSGAGAEDQAVHRALAQLLDGRCGCTGRDHVDAVDRQSANYMVAAIRVGFDDQHGAGIAAQIVGQGAHQFVDDFVVLDRLGDEGQGTRGQGPVARFVG